MCELWGSNVGEQLAYANQFEGLISVSPANVPCMLKKHRSIVVRLQGKSSVIGHRIDYLSW